MHDWHATKYRIAVFLSVFCLTGALSAQDVSHLQGGSYCGIDRNLDGDFDGDGEIMPCDNGVCPINATECITGRVEQVCDPDRTITSCAPDEQVTECEADTVRRECDPDTTRQVCEPDSFNRVCEPDTVERVCEPNRVINRCDPDRTYTVCDPDGTVRECDPDTRVYQCDPSTTRRVCDPDTTERVCDPDTTRQVCAPNTTRTVCEADTVRRVCTTVLRPGCHGRNKRTCVECTVEVVPGVCRSVSVPGECHDETVPGACRNVTTPGSCRTETVPGACRWVTIPGACRTRTVAGQCREVTERGRCYNVEIPGNCEDVVTPGECRDERIPGACRTERVPGECRDVTIPGECTTVTVPGECVNEIVPGECRDEPLPDACPLDGVDACHLGADGISRCSDTACVNTAEFPIEELQRERVAYVNDGTIDESGECLNDVQVFTGRGMDCYRPGLLTLFKNCCKNRGEVLNDSGGSLGAAATVSTVTAVFVGAKAAVSALASGASAAAAGSAGTAALAAAGGPAAIAAGVYLVFTELLGFGCEQQDFETALLDGSGMCHFVGTYCVARIPFIGCIQKARSFCCFNSKLARIIHEQGREQLKAFDGFGEPKTPECRGFTPSEFQALNFSDMDLSEYYDELATQSEAQIKQSFEQGLDAFVTAGKDGS